MARAGVAVAAMSGADVEIAATATPSKMRSPVGGRLTALAESARGIGSGAAGLISRSSVTI